MDTYIRFFQQVDAPLSFAGYEAAQGQLPASPAAYDAYVITGSPRGAYDPDPWIAALGQFIQKSYRLGKKLVGICFGHQILAQALGGRVEKSARGWGLGLKQFTINQSQPWMADVTATCGLYFAHQDQVVALPPGAQLLGSSPACPNAMFAIGDQVVGIQGHPEFSREIMTGILDRLADKIGPDVHGMAVSSLANGHPDGQLVARWLVDFMLS